MAFSGGARRLCIKLSLVNSSGYGRHFTTSACKRAYSEASFISGDANSQLGIGIYLRRFSIAASDQTNLIKQLRERTSAPIKDVKTALVDSNWDIELAQKELRKRGKVLASKKSSRTAAEGLLALAQNENKTAVIELNCETDFVARNEIFQYLALSLAKQALLVENASLEASISFQVRPESLEVNWLIFPSAHANGESTVDPLRMGLLSRSLSSV